MCGVKIKKVSHEKVKKFLCRFSVRHNFSLQSTFGSNGCSRGIVQNQLTKKRVWLITINLKKMIIGDFKNKVRKPQNARIPSIPDLMVERWESDDSCLTNLFLVIWIINLRFGVRVLEFWAWYEFWEWIVTDSERSYFIYEQGPSNVGVRSLHWHLDCRRKCRVEKRANFAKLGYKKVLFRITPYQTKALVTLMRKLVPFPTSRSIRYRVPSHSLVTCSRWTMISMQAHCCKVFLWPSRHEVASSYRLWFEWWVTSIKETDSVKCS